MTMKTINSILRLIVVLISVLTISLPIFSQNNNYEKFFQQRAKERVKLMNDFVSYMADKSKAKKERVYYRKKTLPLFIGRGYSYEENGISKDGVTMQTTSVNRNTVSTDLLRNYFTRLINLHYSEVIITSTEIADMKVSDLKKVDSYDNTTLYMCTCQYVQYFKGKNADGYVYADKTTKRIVCYVEYERTDDGGEYMIQLGDVEAISTERVY